MNGSIVLTDSTSEAVTRAVEGMDGWRVKRVESEELSGAIGSTSGVRLVYVSAADPTIQR